MNLHHIGQHLKVSEVGSRTTSILIVRMSEDLTSLLLDLQACLNQIVPGRHLWQNSIEQRRQSLALSEDQIESTLCIIGNIR
jgi:hypothetical protein